MNVRKAFEYTFEHYWDQPRFEKSGRIKEVKGLFHRCIKNTFQRKQVENVTHKEVQKWYNQLALKSTADANKALGALSKVYNLLIKHGKITFNPCKGIDKKAEHVRSTLATAEELQLLEKIIWSEHIHFDRPYTPLSPSQFQKSRAGIFILLILSTGARPSSIANAKGKDVSFFTKDDKEYAQIKIKGKRYEDTGKMDNIIVPPRVAWLLRKDAPELPITSKRQPQKLWEKLRLEINRPDLWLRDLRRSFASVAINNGVDLYTVSKMLNHSSVAVTQRYAVVAEQQKVDALDIVSQRLGGNNETTDSFNPTNSNSKPDQNDQGGTKRSLFGLFT